MEPCRLFAQGQLAAFLIDVDRVRVSGRGDRLQFRDHFRCRSRALLDALGSAGLVEASQDLRIRTERTAGGGVTVALQGGTFYEQSLFADAMGEVLGPVENPRYIITREDEAGQGGRADFHAVPACLGVNKERAEALLDAWQRHVSPAELIFTRRAGGRELLLAARARAFSAVFEDEGLRRLDRWQ